MTVIPAEVVADPSVPTVEPGNTESKEAAFLRDVAVVKKLQAELEAAIAAIPDSEPPIYFRDWTDIAYVSGYTSASGGQLQYAVIGRQVFLRGGAHRTAGDFTTTAVTVATIPATDPDGVSLRPLENHRYANWGSNGRISRVEVQPGGAIQVRVPDNPTRTIDVDESSGVLDRDVDLDSPFQWTGLSTTYLRV